MSNQKERETWSRQINWIKLKCSKWKVSKWNIKNQKVELQTSLKQKQVVAEKLRNDWDYFINIIYYLLLIQRITKFIHLKILKSKFHDVKLIILL